MIYKINKNLLEEIALQINWKTYTFKEVFDHLDDYVGGVDIDLYDEEGNEIDTWMDRWERFLSDGKPKTLEEVGVEFKVTRERIRQIEAKAIRKMRHPTRSKQLKAFLDLLEAE